MPPDPAATFAAAVRELTELCGCPPKPVGVADGAVNFSPVGRVADLLARDPRELTRLLRPHTPPRLYEVEYAARLGQMTDKQRRRAPHPADLRADWLGEVILDRVQGRLHRAGVTAYSSSSGWGYGDPGSYVGLIPGDGRFEVVAQFHAHFGGDERRPHDMAGFVDWLREVDRVAPFAVRRVTGTGLDLVFLDPIARPAVLARSILDVCGDALTVNSPDGQGGDPVADRLRAERRVTLWWD